ncbi:MAG: peptidase M28, partial [Dehalococcoidales bacterium]
LADASSALYTRYPEGLASALEKLAASTGQLKSANKATAPMYILNPFRKKGRAAANLTSTHPPIAERIRILRSMAGGASFAEYDSAYSKVHGGGGSIVPAATLAAVGAVPLRAAEVEATPGEDREERVRQTSELMWRLGNYKTITCDCGTKLRVPPKFKKSKIRCPHCGRLHPV